MRCLTTTFSLSLLLFFHSTPLQVHSLITEEDFKAFSSWSVLSTPEKLSILLYKEDWYNLESEFKDLDADKDGIVERADFYRVHEDHMSEDAINDIFNECLKSDRLESAKEESRKMKDATVSSPSMQPEQTFLCNYFAYVLTRGVYDKSGNLYDVPEWEMREGVFLHSFVEDMNRPDITDEELGILGIVVDDSGKIVG